MGFTTFVHIYNDGMKEIEENPEEFAAACTNDRLLNEGGTAPIGRHMNLVEVIRSQHADAFQLVASWRNMPLSFSRTDPRTQDICRRLPHEVHDFIDRARRELDMLEAFVKAQEAEGWGQ